MGEDQHLPSIFDGAAPIRSEWERRRASLLERWQGVLGAHSMPEFDRSEELFETIDLPEAQVLKFWLPTSPSTRQQVLLMRPKTVMHHPSPAAIVPFYNPDDMAGYDLTTRRLKERPLIHFGRHLVQQGYVVLCTQAFPYNTVPDPHGDFFAWWRVAAAKVLSDNPCWTGMGKLV